MEAPEGFMKEVVHFGGPSFHGIAWGRADMFVSLGQLAGVHESQELTRIRTDRVEVILRLGAQAMIA